jgi:hypothetical protein
MPGGRTVSTWSWLWIAWLAIFVAVESTALANKSKDDTLSEHIWKWFAIGRPGNRPKMTKLVRLRRLGLLALLAWLAAHFMTGGMF